MKLASRFKFYYKGMPFDTYEAFYDGGDEVLVTWNWGLDMYATGEVVYPAETVKQLIVEGDWVVTEVAAEGLPSNNFHFTDPRDDHEYLYTADVHGDVVDVTWEWKLTDDARSEPQVTYSRSMAEQFFKDGLWVVWQEPALG